MQYQKEVNWRGFTNKGGSYIECTLTNQRVSVAQGQKSYLENPKPPIRVKLDHHDDALKKKMSLNCSNTFEDFT